VRGGIGVGRFVAGLAAVVTLVAACLTTSDVLVDRPWKLVEIGGASPVDPAGIVGVSFGTDGRFRVNTGCRSGGGTYHLDGNRILLDSEILQPIPCDEAMAAQDADVLGVVEGRPTYSIGTGTGRLRLAGEDGSVLLFETP
jgi:heat shock protein HslJ